MDPTEIPGLHASAAARLPFGDDLWARAYLLARPAGNLLIYSTTTLAGEHEAIRGLGGAVGQYLGHWHEAGFAPRGQGAPLHVHERDAEEVRARRPVDSTFADGHRVGDDFEAIPAPGHTPGSTAYLWRHAGHRLLFTADTLFVVDGRWRAIVLDSSDRDAYVASLETIASLSFDVLVPWIADGGPHVVVIEEDEARARVSEVAGRLRTGADR